MTTNTITRTDVHRPSAIQPEDYHFVGQEVMKIEGIEDAMFMQMERERIRAHMATTGGTYSKHAHGGNCHVCGSVNAIYTVLFHHVPSNSYVRMGQDCASQVDAGIVPALKRFRDSAGQIIKSAKGKAKAAALMEEHGCTEALVILKSIDFRTNRFTHDDSKVPMNVIRPASILLDLNAKLVRWGDLSEKQWAFMARLIDQVQNASRYAEERAAADAKSQYIGTVKARMSFTATIVGIASFDSLYGTMFVSIMKSGDNVVIYKGNRPMGERGETVTFKATVKKHDVREGVKQTIVERPAIQ